MAVTNSMKSTTNPSEAGPVGPSVASQGDLPSKLTYMQRPPTILPNYGKKWKHGRMLKTNLPRVLLYDNVTQQTMLNAQISYIQSQRQKCRRHLEMNIKSFLLWKERKQKALLRLTQVQHGHDYARFEVHYYGGVSRTDKTTTGHCNSGFGLLKAQAGNQGGINATTSQDENSKEKQRDRLPALSHTLSKEGNTKPACLRPQFEKENEHRNEIHLPCIKNMYPLQVSHNREHQTNSVIRHVQERNGKPHLEHNSSKVSRSSESAFTDLRIRHTQVLVNKLAIMKPLNIEHIPNTSRDNTLTSEVNIAKSGSVKQRAKINNNSKSFPRNKVETEQPTFDNRFLQLQNILVHLCPANEGLTELSPSVNNKTTVHYEK
ncbi:hypothetical protein BsWGS_07212 [Bradybaena similaris]